MAKLKLVQTCGACPEQYDVFLPDGTEIGYMRLRHGYFRAEYKGDIVYDAHPEGDGVFTDEERDGYLVAASEAILLAYAKDSPEYEPLYTVELDKRYQ